MKPLKKKIWQSASEMNHRKKQQADERRKRSFRIKIRVKLKKRTNKRIDFRTRNNKKFQFSIFQRRNDSNRIRLCFRFEAQAKKKFKWIKWKMKRKKYSKIIYLFHWFVAGSWIDRWICVAAIADNGNICTGLFGNWRPTFSFTLAFVVQFFSMQVLVILSNFIFDHDQIKMESSNKFVRRHFDSIFACVFFFFFFAFRRRKDSQLDMAWK